MKRKIIILSCAVALCFSLSSCELKDAITGNTNPTNTDSSESLSNESEITEEKSTSNKSNDNTSNTDDKTSDVSSSDVTTETNNNLFLEKDSSTITPDKANLSSTSKTVNRDCRIFYFNKVDLKTYCVDTNVTVTDNAFVTALTQELYKAPNNNDNFVVLSKDYGVSSATLNYDTNVLTVKFNENFINDMGLSTDIANGVIGAIVNTYGYNYGVNKVAVYLDNNLYTGLPNTESNGYSTVDYESTLKLD